ncbi:hypothetical protein BCR43DRAFT_483041 [Syncephalastrum racemosum]|uniref:Uncharacterized protein n=1 Tax=Syncephalastrum racemosum TaxID=13706 RepID=A0A1X2HUL2_SYNRA|nr:hypothetical protein BCR43DRAFT_483041 [Syncephalastrum racemosum]
MQKHKPASRQSTAFRSLQFKSKDVGERGIVLIRLAYIYKTMAMGKNGPNDDRKVKSSLALIDGVDFGTLRRRHRLRRFAQEGPPPTRFWRSSGAVIKPIVVCLFIILLVLWLVPTIRASFCILCYTPHFNLRLKLVDERAHIIWDKG